MTNILVLRSSATGDASVSNKLIDQYVAELAKAKPGLKVVGRDLDRDPVPHVTSVTLAGIGRPAPETEAAKPVRALADKLIAELQTADVIVIGAPMYNFGIPSTLKSWFDFVLRAGTTFRYTEKGPEGLLTGKRAVIVLTRGGKYSEGPASGLDHQLPHLRTLLGFIGITDIDVVYAEMMAFGPDAVAQSVAGASAQIKKLAYTSSSVAA
jgi:FMN-dependent NADH-azoreductase